MSEDQVIKAAVFAGNSSTILTSNADHKAWLWRKESLLKTNRYWALVYSNCLYLYKTAQDTEALEMLDLKGASMKKHNKGIRFVLTVINKEKGGKKKDHQLNTENTQKTQQWIS